VKLTTLMFKISFHNHIQGPYNIHSCSLGSVNLVVLKHFPIGSYVELCSTVVG